MKLNADIGEMTGHDADIVPYITMANVACGYHVSDSKHMDATVKLVLATSPSIRIGAHVSYFDKENFGRISLPHSSEEVINLVRSQVHALSEICHSNGTQVEYIKPHGALYHDMMTKESTRASISLVAEELGLPLVVPAQTENTVLWDSGVTIISESFADRAYHEDGTLVSRKETHAVHDSADTIVAQAAQLLKNQVMTVSGNCLYLESDTLCIHGDNPASVTALKQIHALL